MSPVRKGDLIAGKWLLKDPLGNGAFGVVYRGEHIRTRDRVAIKTEPRTSKDKHDEACNEHEIYKFLTNRLSSHSPYGVPHVEKCITTSDEHIMVMERLGPSLDHFYYERGSRFELKTTLLIGIELLYALESLHERGIVHKDVKPSNVLTGPRGREHRLLLADYSISDQFRCEDGTPVPQRSEQQPIGSFNFAPLRAHMSERQSPRDDLEALGYMLVFFSGVLPWERAARAHDNGAVREAKQKASPRTLSSGLPSVFLKFFKYVWKLRCAEMPNHSFVRHKFREALEERNFHHDTAFEWLAAAQHRRRSAR